ncbi:MULTISPECIES: DUF3375 domain-containing protein [Corynebacterium]|uniref:DUF3375 domain-containing protein n=1 Tax=Corynebacterium singulare TaxID=161899 RepID=A0A0B6F607_9CORY|nr:MULTISPECIES: DUF3375 domain-containing protein [Corynebacterium]AJI79466.1 Protein of unknown function (DUF3375) [Corynebacterium singulare]OFT57790.1 hypothetical protein HMPREF3149_11890 [Corynebacterium sp. HMSC05E07]
MSVEARALSLRRLMHDSAAIRLLAADNAPVILALIAEYFPRGTRARPAAEVYELMVTDFEVIASEFPMPRTPQNYCNDWVKAGWLVRKSGRSTRGETLEPSEEALSALEAIERWEQPVTTVTASRVESISSALQRLARDTNEDIASRVASLEAERARIDHEIEKAQLGQFERLTAAETEERVQDVLNMAMAVPSDFARVRHDLEALNHQLRRQLLDPEGYRGDVLEEIFNGVDHIAESDAGRSFQGFYSLLMDRERSAWLDQWIEQVLDSDAGKDITPERRQQLRRLFRDMEETSFEVNQTMTGLARSLRHYVSSEQFAEDRRMIELLREARGMAIDAAQTSELKAFHRMDTPLQRIGMSIHSVSRIRLANPGREVVEEAPVAYQPGEDDAHALYELVRESEIDFEELHEAIRQTVSDSGPCTIAQVLQAHPATQGLASVVGLVHIADQHPLPAVREVSEKVTWTEEDGSLRAAQIPTMYFDHTTVEELQ